MQVGENDRIVGFVEKPSDPPELADRPGWVLASMGIYVFERTFLNDQLRRDAADPESSRDFGRDIIPYLVRHGKAIAHRFSGSCVRTRAEAPFYWRDVGTLDAYWRANIDLTQALPELDVYDRNWPIWTYARITPPAKFVHDLDGRRGMAVSSLVSGGCIISGSSLRYSLLCEDVVIHSYGQIDHAMILPYVDVGRGARLSRVIVDARVKIPPGLVVGEDAEQDAARFRRTEGGICLITRSMIDRITA
jgi:glucose-1-phosphate adenylyltransferase